MELLNQFGFEPVLFLAQIVNFLILFIIFKKFLYKPILKVLKERENKITKGLADAENASQNLAQAQSEKDVIIEKASKEAEKILDDTKKAADDLKTEILEGAKNDAEKILDFAKKQADTQMAEMEKRAKVASLDNSMAILSKVLDSLFNKSEKEQIMQRSMKTLSNEKS